jgi:predicted negative regulator of RcsB-dependent stress response
MLAFAQSVWFIGTGVGVACGGIAAIVMSFAWTIWARRCDPKNTFKPARSPTRLSSRS